MKRLFILLFILLIPIKISAIETSATSAILMDLDNNRILYSKNIHERRSVASISKIMTAVLAIESGKMDDTVIINDSIKKTYGSAIYIKEGEKLKLRDLVYGLMLRSGNDAALAIADFVGGNDFIEMMNNKASEIGMKNTIFNNPHGLDEEKGNYSTAYDMAILTSYAMKLKEYKEIVSTKKYTLKTNMNTYVWKNKNKLLRLYKYTTGGKTGFTKIAKRTLVTTASKDNINLVVVTLNDGNDFKDHQDLFEYGFNNYKKVDILKKGKINIYDEKYYSNYTFYIKNNYSYLISKDETKSITLKFELDKLRKYKTGDKVGVVNVYLGDKKIKEESIYIKKIVKNKSFWDKLKEWF